MSDQRVLAKRNETRERPVSAGAVSTNEGLGVGVEGRAGAGSSAPVSDEGRKILVVVCSAF